MSRLSTKKHGTVKVYIRPKLDDHPWVRNLNGRTTKQLLEGVRKTMAKRLKQYKKDIHYQAYKDGWVFLCFGQRVIWKISQRALANRGWAAGEEWFFVDHPQLHREHPGYDE